jgi:hypothetical protein
MNNSKKTKLLIILAVLLFAGTKSFAQCVLTNMGEVTNNTSVSWSVSFGGCASGSGTATSTPPETNISLSGPSCTTETFTVNGYTATEGMGPVYFYVGSVQYRILIDYIDPTDPQYICGNAIAHIDVNN